MDRQTARTDDAPFKVRLRACSRARRAIIRVAVLGFALVASGIVSAQSGTVTSLEDQPAVTAPEAPKPTTVEAAAPTKPLATEPAQPSASGETKTVPTPAAATTEQPTTVDAAQSTTSTGGSEGTKVEVAAPLSGGTVVETPETVADDNATMMIVGVSAAVVVTALLAVVILLVLRKRSPAVTPAVQPFTVPEENSPSSAGTGRPEASLLDKELVTGQARIPIEADQVIVGRSKQNAAPGTQAIVLPVRTVGRKHAAIEYRGHAYYLVDQGSVNGTFLNGMRIDDAAVLHDGDVIRLESAELTFSLPVESEGERTMMAPPVGVEPEAPPAPVLAPTPAPAPLEQMIARAESRSDGRDSLDGGFSVAPDVQVGDVDSGVVDGGITIAPDVEIAKQRSVERRAEQEHAAASTPSVGVPDEPEFEDARSEDTQPDAVESHLQVLGEDDLPSSRDARDEATVDNILPPAEVDAADSEMDPDIAAIFADDARAEDPTTPGIEPSAQDSSTSAGDLSIDELRSITSAQGVDLELGFAFDEPADELVVEAFGEPPSAAAREPLVLDAAEADGEETFNTAGALESYESDAAAGQEGLGSATVDGMLDTIDSADESAPFEEFVAPEPEPEPAPVAPAPPAPNAPTPVPPPPAPTPPPVDAQVLLEEMHATDRAQVIAAAQEALASAMPAAPAAPTGPLTSQPQAFLHDLDSTTRTPHFEIVKEKVNIGRTAPNKERTGQRTNPDIDYLVIRRNTIGRKHAWVGFEAGGFYVEDFQSINGTYLNGERVVGRVDVANGDEVAFDDFRFRFEIILPPPPPPPGTDLDDNDATVAAARPMLRPLT